jgi:para-nitrobenzyl esterase
MGRDRRVRWRLRRAGIGLSASILVVLGVAVTAAMAGSPTRIIETTSGPVRGLSNGVVNRFQGIRYANSPAGANRWTPPTPPVRSHAVFDATTPGSPCPQQVNQFSASPPFSEDCLFLNVTTPVHSDDDNGLPVWIFIHGGALVTGTGPASGKRQQACHAIGSSVRARSSSVTRGRPTYIMTIPDTNHMTIRRPTATPR